MTNDERNPATAQLRVFRHSGFGFLSSFVIQRFLQVRFMVPMHAKKRKGVPHETTVRPRRRPRPRSDGLASRTRTRTTSTRTNWFTVPMHARSEWRLPMKRLPRIFAVLLGVCLLLRATTARSQDSSLGQFEGHSDVSSVRNAGLLNYDAALRSYLVTGGGENMWFTNDAFHYVWKRMSGDLSLAADIHWIGTGGNAHRKA